MPSPAQVDVWRVALAAPLAPDSSATLCPHEVARADRFRFPRDRRRFIRSHDALRRILGRYLDADPAGLAFEANAYGKPRLASSGPYFNLSHSGDHALVAVSFDCELGVDVEVERELDYLSAARLVFHEDELAQLETQSGAALRQDFFNCWVHREAYLKGLGLGMGDAKSLEPAWGRDQIRNTPREGWQVVGLTTGPGSYSALAAESPDVQWTEQDWLG